MRSKGVSTTVAKLPRRLPQERHLLLQDRAELRTQGFPTPDSGQSAQQSQDSHQGPSKQVRHQSAHPKVSSSLIRL